MALASISNPTVEVAGDTIGIVPGSLSYKTGMGDRKIRSQSAGGSSIETVYTEDAETKISMVKFKLYGTKVNLDFAKTWVAANGVTISLTESQSGVDESFQDMILVTEPEINVGSDGEIEFDFQGLPVIA